jgi:hypothetical protein
VNEEKEPYYVGLGGCCATTKRRGKERMCAQRAITEYDGKPYCYYHNPRAPRKFGEGYASRRDR